MFVYTVNDICEYMTEFGQTKAMTMSVWDYTDVLYKIYYVIVIYTLPAFWEFGRELLEMLKLQY